jgi:hypothetical protein
MAKLISDVYLGNISATETKVNQTIKETKSWRIFTKLSQTCPYESS